MDQTSGSGGKKENIEKSEASSSSQESKSSKPDSEGGSRESLKNSFSLRSSMLGSSVGSCSSSCRSSNLLDSPSKSFILNPPRLSNPFNKQSDDEKEKDGETETREKTEDKSTTSVTSKSNCEGSSSSSSSSSSKVSFVPLGWSSNSCAVSTSSSVSSSQGSSFGSFVFGQNLRDKVEGPKSNDNQTEVSSTTEPHQHENNVEEPKANGTTSEMLFSSAVKTESSETKPSESSKSLSEAAREYEEARSVKRKFEPVQLITGEEHEQNVLQMNCKLFAYDKVSSGWQERGRGLLRLNDSTPTSSRLIIRAHGSLRVLINTKVWAGMVVRRASTKSLWITAMDNSETVKVFLISASQAEMNELQRFLQQRVRKCELSSGSGSSTSCQAKKVKSEDSS